MCSSPKAKPVAVERSTRPRAASGVGLLALVLLSWALLGACATGGPGSDAVSGADDRAAPPEPSVGSDLGGEPVELVRVVDGDTVVVFADGTEERVRLIGVNAPEQGECFAEEATDLLRSLVAGETVVLEADRSDRDQYGRLLRYLYAADGTFLNEALVEQGAARSRRYPPDVAHQDRLDVAEVQAREAGRGLWAEGACGTPAAAAAGDVRIVAAVADPPGPDHEDPNAETVTVANLGTRPADLSGWVLKDTSASHRFTFPDGFVLAPGAEVVVRTGCGTDTATDLHWCNQGSMVWNNDGDTAYLEDPSGNTVSVLDV